MPRRAREKSQTGIYHIIIRGINRQIIFEDEEDAENFLYTLNDYKSKSKYEIYAYCLMGNHVHILLEEGKEDLGLIMKRIGASYVYWYNWKYDRVGHLFQDRYKSEVVESEKYFLAVVRYIHQNPLKAGIVKDIRDYSWSSYGEYVNTRKMVNTDYVLNMFSHDREKARELFEEFHQEESNIKCLDIDQRKHIKDNEAIEIIKNTCNVSHCIDIQKFHKSKRDESLNWLKEKGLSTRQIERLTGISRHLVLKAWMKNI